jgi:hypothetical protein
MAVPLAARGKRPVAKNKALDACLDQRCLDCIQLGGLDYREVAGLKLI